MPRFWLLSAAVAASVAAPSAAWAQDCPPGSWFCAKDAETTPPPPPGPAAPTTPGPLPELPSHAPLYQAAPPGTPPPPGYRASAMYYPPPPPRAARSEWGVQGRIEGILLDNSNRNNGLSRANPSRSPGMGGLGFSLRPRPSPYFALDLGFDFVGGTDYAGEDRTEASFVINPMFFINPRNKLQMYVLAGLGFSSARVNHASGAFDDYTYFGVDGGVGVEWRVLRSIAIDFDLVGFVRGRTDRLADTTPEFTDARTGRTTNTSGGGLLRLGLTYYW